jgi:hypothetical protein
MLDGERCRRTVSNDLLLRCLFRLGASQRDVERLLTRRPPTKAA